jgi:hypothetical protein
MLMRMWTTRLLPCVAVLAVVNGIVLPGLVAAQGMPEAKPVSVMVVGVFHMSNPGHDLHNIQVDDVLAPKRQSELAATNDGLARFHATKVMVEWPGDVTDERYPKYLAGTLPPSRNEVVQLGFRLAKSAKLDRVFGIDVDGDFPYEAVQAYAAAHGQQVLLNQQNDVVQAYVQRVTQMLKVHSIGATLRAMNDPSQIRQDQGFYRQMLRVGAGMEQPGAALVSAWYKRNLLICANLIQNSKPGDHVVVFYGSGHAFLLRQCVAETPGFVLIEPNEYLPQ